MSLYEQFSTNKTAEEAGVRIVYGAEGDTSAPAFTVCRMGSRNREYQKRMAAAMKPYKRQIDSGIIKPEVTESIVMGVFISTVLKAWENVTGRDGKELAFTPENARTLFTDLPDLYADLLEQAQKAETFRIDELEETVKN